MVDVDPDRAPAPPKHAATVMLLRDRDAGGFEVFMVRRHAQSGFMGGAYVFPGGKLDLEDSEPRILARCSGRTPADAAVALAEPDDERRAAGLFVAAVRETFEEAGILLADFARDVTLVTARERLAKEGSFVALLESLDARLRLDRVVPWARWLTPAVEPRRYDTRFFVAVAPPDQEAAHDQDETTEAAWWAPAEALAREAAGEIQLPPPTLRNLELLCAQASAEAVVCAATAGPPPYVDPVFLDRDGAWVLALPGDPDHPTPERAIDGPTRFVLARGRWWSGEPSP